MAAEIALGVLLLELGVILLFAKIFGIIARKLKTSALVGEIIAGILAGPVLGIVHPSVSLEFFSLLGIMLLVFLIGLETNFKEVKESIYIGSSLAVTGSVLTFFGGLLVGTLLFNSIQTGIVIGVIMISTSTAIPMRIMMEKNQHRTRTGHAFITMALADDVIAIMALSLLVGLSSGTFLAFSNIGTLFFTVLGFILLVLTFGSKVIGQFIKALHLAKDEQTFFSITLAIIMAITFLSEKVGLAAITGAFLAGIAMSSISHRDELIAPKISTLGYSLFVPIFFAYSALFLDPSALLSSLGVILIILAVGIATKAVGSGFFARFFGFSSKSQRIIAIGMIPRGEYGIVISQVALAAGMLTKDVYTIMIAFIVLTVILTSMFFSLEERFDPDNSKL
ncbi:MAG: cation:proton antiporter [Candidatus Aenigmarchaeota archaeon]|nr:cation:proton antiporter [Candidatus Aenigmarchaeota archaeon]